MERPREADLKRPPYNHCTPEACEYSTHTSRHLLFMPLPPSISPVSLLHSDLSRCLYHEANRNTPTQTHICNRILLPRFLHTGHVHKVSSLGHRQTITYSVLPVHVLAVCIRTACRYHNVAFDGNWCREDGKLYESWGDFEMLC